MTKTVKIELRRNVGAARHGLNVIGCKDENGERMLVLEQLNAWTCPAKVETGMEMSWSEAEELRDALNEVLHDL